MDLKKGENEQIEANGITLEAIYLPHGIPGFLNLGFLITMGDVTLLHTGDIDPETVDVPYLQAYGLSARQLDVTFVPEFFLNYPDLLQGIWTRYLIPMHFYGRLSPPAGLQGTPPEFFIFSESYESWVLPPP
jgi:hypothetical protein